MFIYLSKKIAIPNNIKLNCLAWNKEQGYIAVGGSDGLLKVLKLDAGGDNKAKGLAAPSNLSMNQTLEGHSGEVQVIVWNEVHQKLTTSDQYGLIIVWMLYKGSWYEEMINNRNKSVVKGMSWSSDGQRICIVYEDGAVIVGSVDGNRIWGKEMKGTKLSAVQWSPNGKNLLFGLQTGEVHIYDNQGNYTAKLPLQFNSMIMGLNKVVVGLDWYSGKNGSGDEPVLALCYYSGHMQLMRYEHDDSSILVDTNMTAVACRWNHNGSILAVVGTMILPGDKNDSNVVQFFTPFGEHVRTLKVPGDSVTSCAWEGGSLRVALAVDSHIYFANIRPDYKWASINNGRVIVYSYTRPDKQGTSICFWDTKTNETFIKQVLGLIAITAFGGFCVVALREEGKKYKIVLFNSISTIIDSKTTDIEPVWLAMNSSHVFIASRNNFLMWPFKTPKLYSTSHVSVKRERIYHVDDIPTGVADVIQDLDASYVPAKDTYPTADPICCIAASDKILLIGRESGLIQHYVLPHVALAVRYSFQSRPYLMSINCDSSKFALIDSSGVLTFQAIQESSEFSIKSQIQTKSSTSLERRDVWALSWAVDNPTLLATMEKTRMYVLRNEEPEEPIISAGYVCCFKDLEIRSVLLDEVMKNPTQPNRDMVQDLEVKSLRDTRELLEKVGIAEATTFIEDNPHPRLWKLLAESALEKMDMKTAENAFVRFTDLQGVQFVKRLQNIHSDSLKKAEIAGYRGNYDEAEKIYLEMERSDLAIQLREKLGDWFRVQELMKIHGAGSDVMQEKAHNALGDYYVERQNWNAAKEYYEKAKNVEKELICAYMLEDWDGLKRIAGKLTEKHPLLTKIGHMLANVGMCAQAADAFVKAGDVKTAIQVCIEQSQWSEATKLAIEFQQPGVTDLLVANAKQLIDSGKVLEAIDFLCNAEQYIEAAKFMFMVADEKKNEKCDPGFLKKLYVLAALIMEEKQKNKISELSVLLDHQTSSEALLDPWRNAEAYHFLLVAQRQLHQGYVDKALRTALSLVSYEDVLPPEEIYCLLALASAASHHYATCSKALCRLQALPNITRERIEEYESLALDLFSRNSPKDPKPAMGECGACLSTLSASSSSCPSCKTVFPVCIASGIPLLNTAKVWTCSVCHHMAVPQDITLRKTCPLCHAPTSSLSN